MLPIAAAPLLAVGGWCISAWFGKSEPKCVCHCACASQQDSWGWWPLVLAGLLLAVLGSVWILILEGRSRAVAASRRHIPEPKAGSPLELQPPTPQAPLAIAAGARKAPLGPPVKRGLGSLEA